MSATRTLLPQRGTKAGKTKKRGGARRLNKGPTMSRAIPLSIYVDTYVALAKARAEHRLSVAEKGGEKVIHVTFSAAEADAVLPRLSDFRNARKVQKLRTSSGAPPVKARRGRRYSRPKISELK